MHVVALFRRLHPTSGENPRHYQALGIFLREKSRFRGPPRNAGHPFGRQGISSPVNAAGIPVGCLASGKREPPANRQTYLCARMRRNNFPHENTRVPRRSAFWPKPQKAAKALFDLPAPSEKRRRRFSTAPIRLGENPFLLIQQECARPVFTLT